MRKIIYLAAVLLFAVAIFIKAHIITGKEKSATVGILSEWNKYGKPIDVVKAEKGEINYIEKVSGVVSSGNIIKCDVSENIASKLRPGQRFTANIKGQPAEGYVGWISPARNMFTGLYGANLNVRTVINIEPGTIVVAKVKVNTLYSVIKIPRSAVVSDDMGIWCWVIEGEVVHKKKIVLGVDNEDAVQVVSGLKRNEQVCTDGMNELSEGDRVRIRKTVNEL